VMKPRRLVVVGGYAVSLGELRAAYLHEPLWSAVKELRRSATAG